MPAAGPAPQPPGPAGPAPSPAGLLTLTDAHLMRPHYVAPSAWIEHVPFAFWLVAVQRPARIVELGTHLGTSYFAFCQAVATRGLGTQCYAVDTWKGDDQAGHYGEDVYDTVSGHNGASYGGFSTLIRSSFDAAVSYFEDGSIDLLHIDGFHSYDAVRHDFETWLPKLSDRGVVLLHDTTVRERGFGVVQLWGELEARFATFQFLHGHGLGVVAVGPDQPAALRDLIGAPRESDVSRFVSRTFATLGRGCFDAMDRIRLKDKLSRRAVPVPDLVATSAAPDPELVDRIAAIDADLGAARRDLAQQTNRADQAAAALQEARARIVTVNDHLQHESRRSETAERDLADLRGQLSTLQSAHAQRSLEAEDWAARAKAADARLAAAEAALATAREAAAAQQTEAAAALAEAGARHETEARDSAERLAAAQLREAAVNGEMARLGQLVVTAGTDHANQITALETEHKRTAKALRTLQDRFDARTASYETLRETARARKQRLAEDRDRIGRLTLDIAALQTEHDTAATRATEAEARRQAADRELQASRAARDEIYASRSWRFSAPIRWIGGLLRRGGA